MTNIIYFSCSGQGKYLARQLSDKLKNEKVLLTDITSIDKRNECINSLTGENMVVIFPVYGGDIPEPLDSFFSNLQCKHINTILLALWGNAHIGKSLSKSASLLSERGYIVSAAAAIVANHSYLSSEFPIKDFNRINNNLKDIIDFVQRNLNKDKPVKLQPEKDNIIVKLLCRLPRNSVPRLASKILLNTDECTKCGLCIKKCPVNAIDKNLTIDNKKCIRCLNCVSVCPVNARIFKMKKIGFTMLSHHNKVIKSNKYYENI